MFGNVKAEGLTFSKQSLAGSIPFGFSPLIPFAEPLTCSSRNAFRTARNACASFRKFAISCAVSRMSQVILFPPNKETQTVFSGFLSVIEFLASVLFFTEKLAAKD